MKKVLSTLLLSLALLFPRTSQTSAAPTTPFVDAVLRSTVRLDIGDIDEDGHGVCTGSVVSASKGWVLTAEHCINGENAGKPVYVDGAPSQVLKEGETMALVAIEAMVKPPLEVRKDEVAIGEDVWMFGYAWGHLNVFRRMISSYEGHDALTDGPLAPGMSGGPVVDAKGKLVAVNQASNQVIGVTCGVKEIKAFLSSR